MAAVAADLLREAPPRFALAGLSMGGIVAMEVVPQALEGVEHLALLDTNALAEGSEAHARRAGQIAGARGGDLVGVMRDEMKPNCLADTSDTALLDLCLDMARTLGPEVFRRQSFALRDRPDQTATLAAFTGPSLALTGEHDRPCPRDRHELTHRLMPQSRLVIVPGARHQTPLERPNETLTALKDWLAQ